ncbi:RobA family efflux pump transcriptional activator [Pectobacterium carotovorum subsp. carotovorum]|nr:RobA family efflux pump transcriptional activator [Pectobacterium carotovorum subsp. carotovorum]
MNAYNVIIDLIEWIENHLTTKLSLDTVANKSGYSKWHLQRLFKKSTGCKLSTYIRSRKLSMAAIELRMTRTPILDIALRYNFDSQQTFSRAFKNHFKKTPGVYRNKDEWDYSMLYPPYPKTAYLVLEPMIVSLPKFYLKGLEHRYICLPENMNQFDMNVRTDFLLRHFRNIKTAPKYIYGLIDITPYTENKRKLEINYTTAADTPEYTSNSPSESTIVLNEGSYIQFNYFGRMEEFQSFILAVNQYHLPKLGVIRRKGVDIEQYYLQEQTTSPWKSNFLNCNYLIPCANASSIEERIRKQD